LTPLIPRLTSPTMITSVDLPTIVSYNPNLAYQLVIALLMAPPNNLPQGIYVYLDSLTSLPPTLPSFDLLGRLLREPSAIPDPSTGGKTTIADIVRSEVLGRFIHESIKWLESAEREEREGLVSDDRFAKGVQNVSFMFYSKHINLLVGSSVAFTPPYSNSRSLMPLLMYTRLKWLISPYATLASRRRTICIASLHRRGFDSLCTFCAPMIWFLFYCACFYLIL